jgi:AraC-like DNA-binding protein
MDVCCSAKLLQPLIEFAATNGPYRDLVPEDVRSVHPDARVSLETVHAMLDRGVERTRDEALGLKLGQTMCLGEGGVFDYGMRSAPTMREAVAFAERYASLLSDSLHVSFEIVGARAVVRLENETLWPRAAAGFAMSAWYKLHIMGQVPSAAHIECWFPHSVTRNASEYHLAFAGAAVKFDAPFNGFAFDRIYENAPSPGADPGLHSMLRARVDSVRRELSRARIMTTAVRRHVVQEMYRERLHESALAERVAAAMRMSRRTLSRKLEHEGTSFTAVANNLRRETALAYVLDTRLPLTEVAFLLGFSHVESFHRAFKRWTGQTPISYRTANGPRTRVA